MNLIRGAWERRRWSSVAGLLGAVAAGLLTLAPNGFVERWERRTHDLRFQIRGPRDTRARIVIAAVADSTLTAWPEPIHQWGSHLAAAITRAEKLGAARIGLDLILAVPGSTRSVRDLAEALSHGKVVLANARPAGQEVINPIAPLVYAHPEQQLNIGFIDFHPELDEVARRAFLFYADDKATVPSFPAVLALRLCGASPADPEALRALAGPTQGGTDPDSVWINYVGPPGSFRILPVEKLVAGQLNQEERQAIQNAVVLIGPAYAGSNDQVRGPMRREKPNAKDVPQETESPGETEYNGVEVHAHTLASLIDGRPLRRRTRGQEALLAATLGVAAALAVVFLPFGRGLLLVGTAGGLWWWLAVRAFAADALWPVAGPLLALGLAWTGHTSVRAVEEALRRAWLQGLFGRYISPEIVDHLLRNPASLELGGIECEVSVLFVDIRGYTTASQGRSPSAVMDDLNTLFREIVPVIDRCEGLVLKYTGDGLLGVFGAPRAVANHAQAAVTAAREIVRVSRQLSAAREQAGGAPLRIGCAVHSGLVVCGNLGWSGRSEYTVIGDTVNVAARLEELNKRLELNTEFVSEALISRETYDRLTEPPPTRGPFEFQIRGREGRVGVYQLRIDNG